MLNLEESLINLIKEPIENLGYILWGIELKHDKYSRTVCIYIDKDDGVTVDDCSEVIQYVKTILNVDDSIPDNYLLEVSSPGLDRILFTLEQYQMYLNSEILLNLRIPIRGKKKITARLISVDENIISVDLNGTVESIYLTNIKKATIVPVI